MLAKVVNGVKRRSTPKEPREETQPRCSNQVEDLPPALVRWSDFKDPFPVLSPGAYRKYYMVYGNATTDELPSRRPLLSSIPELPSPTDIPEKSALFAPRAPITPQRLTIIHEASVETMRVGRADPPSQHSPLNSLRRRRRQVLRTPSVERDLASIARLVFKRSSSEDIKLVDDNYEPPQSATHHSSSSSDTSSTTTHNSHSTDDSHSTVSATSTPLSPISRTSSESSDSSDSGHSDTSPSDLVITPLTSVSDVHEDREGHPQKEIHAFHPHERPDSWCSFSTARTDFCDI